MTGYPERMRAYFAEMFPLGRHLLIAAATYLATAAVARDLHDVETSVWSAYLLLGVWSYLAVPLMLRLMDELKDLEIDQLLFAERPLPSGRVKQSDIKTSLMAVILIYLGANAFHRLTLIAAVVITGYALLMFKRFFAAAAHRDSLPLRTAALDAVPGMGAFTQDPCAGGRRCLRYLHAVIRRERRDRGHAAGTGHRYRRGLRSALYVVSVLVAFCYAGHCLDCHVLGRTAIPEHAEPANFQAAAFRGRLPGRDD
jgi:hypothetical protein